MKNKKDTIVLTFKDDEIKKIDSMCKGWGITRDEWVSRAIFSTLFDLSRNLTPKKKKAALKIILDNDTDIDYYISRVEAIKELNRLEGTVG